MGLFVFVNTAVNINTDAKSMHAQHTNLAKNKLLLFMIVLLRPGFKVLTFVFFYVNIYYSHNSIDIKYVDLGRKQVFMKCE